MTTLLMGTVSCDPHPKSGYVRIESPQHDCAFPLSLKASLNGFGRCDVSKGDIVTVERTSGGYRGWKLLKVNKVQDTEVPPIKTCVTIKVTTDDPDRVRFFLPKRYFQTRVTPKGMSKGTCLHVLCKAFDMLMSESQDLMQRYPDGFHIVCRQDQFARFIVYRNDAGECINGIKDLEPELITGTKITNPYDQISRCTGVERDDVKRVLQAANYSGGGDCSAFPTNEVQVWER